MLRRQLGLVLLLLLSVLLGPRVARADQPGAHTVAVAVLSFDSEDAEPQADALTGALRSRIRSAPGWSLLDTTQSLGMLTAALRCPSRPPPDCQQKISEQIKVDRYIWGFVAKGPTTGQVTAEIHFYQKGKADTVVKESYADNLTDPNDDKGVGKVAAHILDRLGGSAMGVVVVRAGDAATEVIVDAEKHVPLQAGQARIERGAGGHAIEVQSPGAPPTKRNVLVTAGKETVVDIEAGGAQPPPGAPPPGAEPSKPFPTRKVLAGAAIGVGAVLGAVSIVNIANWSSSKSDGNNLDTTKLPAPSGGRTSAEISCDNPDNPVKDQACKLDKQAKRESTIAWVTGGLGVVMIGVGAVLFVTDPGTPEKSAEERKKTRVVPMFGGGTGGLLVTGGF